MKKLVRGFLLATAALTAGGVALAADPVPLRMGPLEFTIAESPQVTDPELPEIEIIAPRITLRELRETIVRTEDDFYEWFNRINDDDQFDITCEVRAPTGTRIPRRSCRANFQVEALRAEGVATLVRLQGATFGVAAPPAMLSMMAKQEEGRRKLAAALRSSPTLQELVVRRQRLETLYEAVRREKFKDRWIVFE